MAQVQKQLLASQKKIVGLVSLPHYGELRSKQLARLMDVIGKSRLTLEESASVLASLDCSLWDDRSIGQLRTLVADQTVEVPREDQTHQRAKQQDFSALPHYLDGEWWRRLETAVGVKQEKNGERLCKFAARLGLTNPTEETYAFLCVLSFALPPGTIIFDCDKLGLLAKWKAVMRRHLKSAAPPVLQPQVLPLSVDQCPAELLRSAYPEGFASSVPVHTTVEEVTRLGRTWPLRSTNVVAAVTKASSFSGALEGGHMVQAVAAATVQAMASQLHGIALRSNLDSSFSKDQELPGFKLLAPPREEASKADAQLALMDQPMESKSSMKADAAGMIDALREDLETEKKLSCSKKKKKNQEMQLEEQDTAAVPKQQPSKKAKHERKETGFSKTKASKFKDASESSSSKAAQTPSAAKKPAAAQPCLKRPAAKAVLKRPAAKPVRLRAPMTLQQREAKRKELFRIVPRSLKALYILGCSKCRGVQYCTFSCWRDRGFTVP